MAKTLHYTVELNLNLDKYNRKLDKAQEVLINAIKRDTEEYVPAKTLALTKSAHIRNDNTELVYSTPYARYQYGGYVMTDALGRTFVGKGEKKPIIHYEWPLKYTESPHPNATSRWGKVSESKNRRKWIQEVKDVIKNG
ncbi:MAG: minor capsid protein [Lachnospiraceae bacterium]|nr:minor capsid protein [Lachnospiraceae bacterium]